MYYNLVDKQEWKEIYVTVKIQSLQKKPCMEQSVESNFFKKVKGIASLPIVLITSII